jgi:hypothetical protein
MLETSHGIFRLRYMAVIMQPRANRFFRSNYYTKYPIKKERKGE